MKEWSTRWSEKKSYPGTRLRWYEVKRKTHKMKLKPNETKSNQGPTRWSEKALEPDLWSVSSHPPSAQKSHMAVTKIDVGRGKRVFKLFCAEYCNLNQYGTKLAMTKAWDGTRLRWRGTEKKQDGDDRRPRWRLGPVQCSRCIQCTKCTLCTVTRDHGGVVRAPTSRVETTCQE